MHAYNSTIRLDSHNIVAHNIVLVLTPPILWPGFCRQIFISRRGSSFYVAIRILSSLLYITLPIAFKVELYRGDISHFKNTLPRNLLHFFLLWCDEKHFSTWVFFSARTKGMDQKERNKSSSVTVGCILHLRQIFRVQDIHRFTASIFQYDNSAVCVFLCNSSVKHRFTFIIHCIWISTR